MKPQCEWAETTRNLEICVHCENRSCNPNGTLHLEWLRVSNRTIKDSPELVLLDSGNSFLVICDIFDDRIQSKCMSNSAIRHILSLNTFPNHPLLQQKMHKDPRNRARFICELVNHWQTLTGFMLGEIELGKNSKN